MSDKRANALDDSHSQSEKNTPSPDSRTSVLLSMKELCKLLSISTATGKNWLKSGKLIPEKTSGKISYFTPQYVEQFEQDLLSGKSPALKSRRNKKYIAGLSIYHSYLTYGSVNYPAVQKLFSLIHERDSKSFPSQNKLILAECALRLFCQRNDILHDPSRPLLTDYLCGNLHIAQYSGLIDNFIPASEDILQDIQKRQELFCIPYKYNNGEDLLGLLYLSLKNIGSRKASGAYYTPMSIAKQLVDHLTITTRSFQGMNILEIILQRLIQGYEKLKSTPLQGMLAFAG